MNAGWSAFCPRSATSADGSRHGLCATPPSARRASFDRASVKLQRGRDGYQRECIGEAVADLQIAVICRKAQRWKLDRRDDLVRLQIGVVLGVLPGSRWKSANAIARVPAGPST